MFGIDATISAGSNDDQNIVLQICLAVILRLVLTAVTILAAGFVGVKICQDNRVNKSLLHFLMANTIFAIVIGVAIVKNGIPAINTLMTIIYLDTRGIDCRMLEADSFPYTASLTFLAVTCFDRLHTIVGHYKKRGYIAVIIVWVVSLIAGYSCLLGDLQSDPAKSQTGNCYDNYLECFRFDTSILSLPIANVFALALGIYYKCVNDMARHRSRKPLHFHLKKAWSNFKEDQQVSAMLLVTTSASITIGISITAIVEMMQTDDSSILRAILVSTINCKIIIFKILLHTVYYGLFRYTD